MKRFLLLALTALGASASINAPSPEPSGMKQIDFVSTASWVVVSALPAKPSYRKVLIENYTDGDVELAFGNTALGADIRVKKDTDKVVDDDVFVGTLSVRNITGTGGHVYLRVWP